VRSTERSEARKAAAAKPQRPNKGKIKEFEIKIKKVFRCGNVFLGTVINV
jgi:hypothetical protein